VRWAVDDNLDCSVHNKGSSYIFADGHAKWMRFAQTMDPVNLWADEAFDPKARTTIYNSHWTALRARAKTDPRVRACLE
jgi:prepilin-type processing-associated H-X9-DG protein